MRAAFCTSITISVMLIVAFDWQKLKGKPIRDRAAFLMVLILVWTLSMLNLPKTPGPVTALEMLFRPIIGWIEP